MIEIIDSLNLFVYGFIVGYVWYPLWSTIKTIWKNAKTTQEKEDNEEKNKKDSTGDRG